MGTWEQPFSLHYINQTKSSNGMTDITMSYLNLFAILNAIIRYSKWKAVHCNLREQLKVQNSNEFKYFLVSIQIFIVYV